MFKKHSIGLALLAVCCTTPVWADEPNFSQPIPIVSDTNQIENPAHTDATNFKFFRHPTAPAGGKNFAFPLITLPDGRQVHADILIDGQPYLVSDVVATPGLMPPKERVADNSSGMIDDLGARRDIIMDPIQGFCQGEVLLQNQNGQLIDVAIDCQVDDKKNVMLNRQLQLADIRQDPANELGQLLGADPLVVAVIGSAQESVSPYSAALYPASVGERSKVFYSFLAGKPDLRESKEIVAYDLAELEGLGVVSTAYDHLQLQLKMALSAGVNLNGGLGEQGRIFENTGMYFSPLMFFRKDSDDAVGRVKLSGYSAFKIPDFLFDARNGLVPDLAGVDFQQLGILPLLSQNAAPIAVEEMVYAQADVNDEILPGKRVPADGLHGMAVVNQALWGDWTNLYLNDAGRPFISDVGGAQRKIYKWFDVFGFQNPQGDFVPLRDQFIFPSNLKKFSHAVFWGRFGEKWGQHQNRGNLIGLNPNNAYDAFMTGFVGPQSYDAAVLENGLVEEGVRKTTMAHLVVPAGVSFEADAARASRGAIYSLNPVGGKRVYFMDPALPLEPAQELPIVWPEVYEVDLPSVFFVPYNIKSAELGRKGREGKLFCGDVVLTFRGIQTIAAHGVPFKNDVGEPVLFRVSDNDQRMFSDHVHVHFGFVKQEGQRVYCALSSEENAEPDIDLLVQSPLEPMNVPAQVASVQLADFDGDGSTDLLVGDLVPRKIPEGQPDEGRYTAYAYLYPSFVTAVERVPQPVRTGFKTFTYGEVGIAEPQDVQSVARAVVQLAVSEDHKGLLGAAALEADKQQEGGAHIGVINGLPLTVAPFGCPKLNNAEVSSPVELLQSLTKNLRALQIADQAIANGDGLAQFPIPFIDQGATLAQSCANKSVCTMNLNGNAVELPFWQEDACCQNACDENSLIWKNGTCKRFLDLAEPGVDHGWADRIIVELEEACAQNNDPVGDPAVPPEQLQCERNINGVQYRLPLNIGDACCVDPCGANCLQEMVDNDVDFPLDRIGLEIRRMCAAGDDVCPEYPFISKAHVCCGGKLADIRGVGARESFCTPECQGWLNQQNPLCPAPNQNQNPVDGTFEELCKNFGVCGIPINHQASLDFFQPDRVYVSQTHYIADAQDLHRAQIAIPLQGNIQAVPAPGVQLPPPNIEPAGGVQAPRAPNGNVDIFNQQPNIQADVVQPIPGAFDNIQQNDNGFVFRFPPVVRLPMGKAMLGARELNVIVNKAMPQAWECAPHGPLDRQAGGECNLDNACAAGSICGIDCQCHNDCGVGPLEAGEECNRDNACGGDEICNIDCQCVAPLILPGPGPNPAVNSNLANSCECHASGFSSTAAKNAYAGYNQDFRNASGINGDLWGEPEFSTMNCICVLPGAAAPGLNADIGVNLAGSVLPNVPGNVRPWALVQDSGLMPTMNYNNAQWRPDVSALVAGPILLLPNDAAQMNAAVLPDLAVNPSFAAATPLPAGNASVIADPSGTQITDIGRGMLRHVLFTAMPGSLIQFQGTRVQLPDLSVASIGGVPNTGAAVHEISIRIPPDYAAFTGIEGYKGSKNIEDRLFDGEMILAEVKAKCDAARQVGKFCGLNDFDFKGQWESNLYFHGAVVANTFSKAGEPSGTATAELHVLGGAPFSAGAAHSCGCNTAVQAPSAAEALAQILAFMGVLAVWKRLRKKA